MLKIFEKRENARNNVAPAFTLATFPLTIVDCKQKTADALRTCVCVCVVQQHLAACCYCLCNMLLSLEIPRWKIALLIVCSTNSIAPN